eukprot:TRINITY_DN5942_c2_g4_i3.p1 TRINITY_DN5942_c2_g4~~TRINITY_DN5942_c2_g4_i3.p1  ORF type:complete len:219 (+),score=73.70 TRINITY_DN5942_c2_g4_i3:66-659(+)
MSKKAAKTDFPAENASKSPSGSLSGHVRGMKFMRRAQETAENDAKTAEKSAARWKIGGFSELKAAVLGEKPPKKKAPDGAFSAISAEIPEKPDPKPKPPKTAAIPIGLGRRSFGGFDGNLEKIVRETDRKIRKTESEENFTRAKFFGFASKKTEIDDEEEPEPENRENHEKSDRKTDKKRKNVGKSGKNGAKRQKKQ